MAGAPPRSPPLSAESCAPPRAGEVAAHDVKTAALPPRVRDFRGLSSTAFDGHGNYSLGLSEQMVFPEINPDKFTRPQGMNITLVTSARNDDEAREFLRAMGVPLKKDGEDGGAAA